MTLLGNWDNNSLPTIGTQSYNDVWGYAAGGREYAILGTVEGFYIIDVTLPASPTVITFQPMASNSSVWRDFKTYKNHLYAVSDQGTASALEIYDLSNLPTSITQVHSSQTFFSTCHNIQVNANSGILYAAGTTTSPNGVILLDIDTNPANPTQLANFTLGAYVHDVFVQNDTCVAFFGNTGTGIFDFSNLLNPSAIDLLLSFPDPGYAHSGWATPDWNYLYWATETPGTSMKIADFSSGVNLDVVGTFGNAFLAPTHTNSTAHNPFIKDDFLYVAYYEDGLVFYDISNRTNPVLAGYYDTEPNNTDYNGNDGCWGVYPYLPSGNILASDQVNGLFIFSNNITFPVEITDYRIENLEAEVRMAWTTTREINHDQFQIQRSPDGENFTTIGTIAGDGDRTEPRDYEFFDYQPLEGRSYYRVVQVDLDGSTTEMDILQVRRGKSFQFIGVSPNPASRSDQVRVEFDLASGARMEILVTDLLGKIVYQEIDNFEEGFQSHVLNSQGWTPGAYLVRITSEGKSYTSKLLLNR